jgi:hypothetical protein
VVVVLVVAGCLHALLVLNFDGVMGDGSGSASQLDVIDHVL